MNESKITTRYAKALFNLAKENNKLEEIKKDIDIIYNTLNDVELFGEFLHSPIIKVSKKQEIFNYLFKGKVDEISLSFLNLITKNKRENNLKIICLNFIMYYMNHFNIIQASIKTAQVLSKKNIGEFKELLKKSFKSEIELKEQVDEHIIGGFILTIEDNQYDASVATKLKNIKRELVNS